MMVMSSIGNLTNIKSHLLQCLECIKRGRPPATLNTENTHERHVQRTSSLSLQHDDIFLNESLFCLTSRPASEGGEERCDQQGKT